MADECPRNRLFDPCRVEQSGQRQGNGQTIVLKAAVRIQRLSPVGFAGQPLANRLVADDDPDLATHPTVYFSPDQQNVYPLTWRWDGSAAGNPVTIGANAAVVSLAIYSGVPLHGVWTPSVWTYYSTGYFRVLAWR
jgi:hypothetical protein